MLMSKDSNKVKSTHLLPKDLLNRLKKIAIDQDTNVTAILVDLIKNFVEKNEKK